MNAFEQLADRVKARFGADFTFSIEEPVTVGGTYFLTLASGRYIVEIEWHRHRGFGVVAGENLVFGSGVDEIFGSADAAFERIQELIDMQASTSVESPVHLIDLRKLRGLLQKDVAERLGITKSGLAQMERADALTSMQIDTLRKLISSLGGELVLRAHFPEGRDRRIALD